MHCRTMGEKYPLQFCSLVQSCTGKSKSILSFFSAIFAGPRSVEIQKFCYHGTVTQCCHGIKMCFYVCLRQLPSFSYQIIKGPHFYSAATTAETLFTSESHSVIDWEMKNLGRPVTEKQVLFTKETNIFR